jgi:dihydroorotate dehydrogenase (NAD+) catalytic subunit
MLAGATAVQVGTATFLNPTAMIDIIEGLAAFCAARSIQCVAELTGALCREEADEAELDWLEPAP